MKTFVKKLLPATILLFVPLLAGAQTVTPNAKDTGTAYIDTIIPKKILIVPFFPKMFMSDINKELVQGGKSDLWNVVARFSLNITTVLKQELSPKLYTPEVLTVKNSDPKTDDDLKLVDRSISYSYEPLPVLLADKKKGKKVKTVPAEEQQGGDNAEKYMKTIITNPKLLSYLHEKYGFDYVIFLNQFDIRNDYSNPEATISGPTQRMLKLHYTAFNANGEQVCSNRSAVALPMNVTKADDIIKKYFVPLIKPISACLPEGAYVKQQVKK